MAARGFNECRLSPELTAGELTIVLYPQQHDVWKGTKAQLEAEGLVPDGFKWPERTERRSFTYRGIECFIERRRLPGTGRGPWVDVDNWLLWRLCKGRGIHGGPEIYEKQQALKHELWLHSPEGSRMAERHWRACEDAQFQAFKQRALGIDD